MRKKVVKISRSNGKVSKKRDRSRLSAFIALTVCGTILLVGFFFAARQHFASMEYGIRNSRLRKQLDDLQAEKRRLLYAREVAVSPVAIKKAAKKNGLLDETAPAPPAPELASMPRTEKKAAPSMTEEKPTVIKTASTKPTAPRTERAVEVLPAAEKPQKATVASE